jgi:hypothetical protein
VKPLRAILKVLDKDAVVEKPAKTAEPKKSKTEKKVTNSVKIAAKKSAAKAPKQNKPVPVAAKLKQKAAPKQKAPVREGKPSFASQVRELILDARKQDKTQADVIELAVNKLGMNRSSARNCVLFNWERM